MHDDDDADDEKVCGHPTVYGGLCVACGRAVKKGGIKFVPKSAAAAGPNKKKNNKVEISVAEADRMASLTRERLDESKRLSLVLDLDHTLVECAILARAPATEVHELVVQGRAHQVRLRPKLGEFFDKLCGLYEPTIYTHGSREYAIAVAKLIEAQTIAKFGGRIVSRDDAPDLSAKAEKRLDRVFPGAGGTESSLVVDDRHDVWQGADLDHLVLVEPYKFFERRGLVAPYQDLDTQLAHTRRALVEIHEAYFKNGNTTASAALKQVRSRVFSNDVLCFVALPRDLALLRRFAVAFGATVEEDPDSATCVVVDERRRDRTARCIRPPPKSSASYVHLDWFWYSIWHLDRKDPARFYVPPHEIIDFPVEDHPPAKRIRRDDTNHQSTTAVVVVPDDDDAWADDVAAEIADDVIDDDDDDDDDDDGDQ
ncbi:hypothetical protein CTAYLR_006349 [Chrysophaeum taylorii]|uniref:protein-serine/threonine phosphatase n=1 Tax=Chrysophaeum taylorii TaxID=2483200 RepID=A0AAD7U779_9STRA|nr:hypothetical protein CTAYLR_006349 [Chrysophaeum taylorii]